MDGAAVEVVEIADYRKNNEISRRSSNWRKKSPAE